MLSLAKLIKNLLLWIPITYVFKPFTKLFYFIHYFNQVQSWIRSNNKNLEFTDYFTLKRDYGKRVKLYEYVANKKNLIQSDIIYLEFGVASAVSFRWWLNCNKNDKSNFYGFDTFEGLPEDWGGFYEKGAMSHSLETVQLGVSDTRAVFVKGLFQDTLVPFIQSNQAILNSNTRKVIHMDADLYSATIFSLAQLYPYLKKGDIILFDEFNVPLHEFKAYKEFVESYYIKLKPIGAVNNFYQVAFEVE